MITLSNLQLLQKFYDPSIATNPPSVSNITRNSYQRRSVAPRLTTLLYAALERPPGAFFEWAYDHPSRSETSHEVSKSATQKSKRRPAGLLGAFIFEFASQMFLPSISTGQSFLQPGARFTPGVATPLSSRRSFQLSRRATAGSMIRPFSFITIIYRSLQFVIDLRRTWLYTTRQSSLDSRRSSL